MKRLVDSAILENEDFNDLPQPVQNLAFRIAYIVDDYGIFRADARHLKNKAAAFCDAITEDNIPAMVEALEKVDFLRTFSADGKLYAVMTGDTNRHKAKPIILIPEEYKSKLAPIWRQSGANLPPIWRISGRQPSANQAHKEITKVISSPNGEGNNCNACAGGGVSAPPRNAEAEEEEVTPEALAAIDKEIQEQFDNDHER